MAPRPGGAGTVSWSRDRLDGAAGYAVELQAIDGGRVLIDDAGRVQVHAAPGQATLRLRFVALTGDPPLVPLEAEELLLAPADAPRGTLHTLLFLAYRDVWFAGSWRFQTYFGRDTLMTVRLLLPALQPAAIEAALGTVLARLSLQGDVAHEEDVGEFAILLRLARGERAHAEPIYDYKMIDDDFMLLPVVAAYLLDTDAGRARGAAFLAARDGRGMAYGELLMRNAALVMAAASPFAAEPTVSRLIRLKPGETVGDWRDSADGLGGGVYPYSVNAALVPSALRALAALNAEGLLQPYEHAVPVSLTQVADCASLWEEHAPRLFDCRVPSPHNPGEVVSFAALSLDDAGQPLPVMHSDFAFALLFGAPAPERIEQELGSTGQRFPAGLMTDVGMLVANGSYGDDALRTMFGADRYHGAVVWSWQQALLAAGLARQLRRVDLPESTRALLRDVESMLWRAIEAAREVADGELWSWSRVDGHDVVRPFGPLCATADESNAAQLWSCVYIAVQPPRDSTS